MNLTSPQIELLLECPTTCVRAYKPAQRLVSLGLALWPSESSDRFILTSAGEARALSEREGQDG